MDLLVSGMCGLGDNLHQRALLRQLLARGDSVWLETPWPCVYHDLVGPRLKLVERRQSLRTQAKNARREAQAFNGVTLPMGLRTLRVWYAPEAVRKHGAVLRAMLASAGLDPEGTDFSLPVPARWQALLAAWLARWRPDRPLLLYRPLVERTEWGGCAARNPDHHAYAALLAGIRERFFVVSVADLEPGKEWLVGHDVRPDAELHRGELPFEALAALAQRAALVYASPGFAIPLAQAVGTPSVCVFGGYEDSHSFSAGARQAPHLGIDPIQPCQCFSHSHRCAKAIDLPRAIGRLNAFVDRLPTIRQSVPYENPYRCASG